MNYREKFDAAFARREELYGDEKTDCFRLFNGEGDGIRDLTIDRYGEYLLLQFFSHGVTVDEKGRDIVPHLAGEAVAAAATLPGELKGVLVKNRAKIDSPGTVDFVAARRSRVIEGERPPSGYTVQQCGARISVDLIEGQSTGLFLDMREVRQRLESFYGEVKPASMLNLFCYTGIFSVHGLLHGVRSAVNVDLSRAVLKKAMENYRLNGFDPDDRDFIYGDALSWSQRMAKKGRAFDFIVVDPPTFARNRKRTFSVKKDLITNLKETIPLHSNAMQFRAFENDKELHEEMLFSIAALLAVQ